MPDIFTFKGYTKPDPLDKAPASMQYILMMSVSFVVSILLVYLITDVFGLLKFKSFFVKVTEVFFFTFITAPAVVYFRKSGSLFLILIILIPLFIIDIILQANFRDKGIETLWSYLPGTFIDNVKILPLRFLMTLSFDAFIFGPFCLWISRISAGLIYKNSAAEQLPSIEQQKNLFRDEWSKEETEKPVRDAGYWILRLLGFSYLSYLCILITGIFGHTPWPEEIAQLISMTYKNPALAVNTFCKIGIMILLTFTGAYNVSIRYYCAWGLTVGHAVSTICSLGFYFYDLPGTDYRDFLLTSAIVDGVMIILFVYIIFSSKKSAIDIKEEKDLPEYFSAPLQLMRIALYIVSAVSALMSLLALYLRFFKDGTSGLEAVYGYPDPALGNTITLYLTISFIGILLAGSEKLRNYLFEILLFPFLTGAVVTVPLFILKDITGEFYIHTRTGGSAEVYWYFMIFIIANIIIFSLLIGLRKLYYDVDFVITSLSPSSAKNVMALSDAFFGGDAKKNTSVLQMIDKYISGIKGRKRGLLNFPFWIVENVLNIVFGLRPCFSVMSRNEQRYFLKKYLLRSQVEIAEAFVPNLAEFGFQIGIAVNAMIMFANYSNINVRYSIGYIPPEARDRLQGDAPMYEAPFKSVASLPENERDAANNKPDIPKTKSPLIAPRVTTPYYEAVIEDEADYVIIGSGAGGAVMSYRLACSADNADKIYVIERGNRYQPLQDFNFSEMEMMSKIYKEGGLQQTKKFTMSVLQGECVGGTTVMNNAVCVKMSSKIMQRWQEIYDLDLSEIENEYERIAGEIEISELDESGINKIVMQKFKSAVEGYNKYENEKLLTVYPLKANYRNLTGDENWNLGNKLQRKRTMLETYLPWSEAKGVRIIPNMTAVKMIMNNRKAEYVLLRLDNGEIKKVKIKKALIIAGGVISSSHFLMRSGFEGNTGKNLSCNFAFPFTFQFRDEIKAYDGNQITLGAFDKENRAAFETYFNPPASFSLSSVPFYFNRREDIMKNYSRLINFGALVGSEPNGIINKKPDLLNGQAFTWELGKYDIENIKFAFKALLKLGYYAGAEKAVIPMKPGIELNLSEENIKLFAENLSGYPLRMNDLLAGTAHPQGGNIMTGSKSEHKDKRVVNENFLAEGTENVFVCDASVFPESMGINPQWTIMALSSLASGKVLKKFG